MLIVCVCGHLLVILFPIVVGNGIFTTQLGCGQLLTLLVRQVFRGELWITRSWVMLSTRGSERRDSCLFHRASLIDARALERPAKDCVQDLQNNVVYIFCKDVNECSAQKVLFNASSS